MATEEDRQDSEQDNILDSEKDSAKSDYQSSYPTIPDLGGSLQSTPTHKDKVAGRLALACFFGLCCIFLIHSVFVFYLVRNRADAVEQRNHVFGTWVPIFSGLVGSAATFYFTKDRR